MAISRALAFDRIQKTFPIKPHEALLEDHRDSASSTESTVIYTPSTTESDSSSNSANMYGGPPPAQSPEEIREKEEAARRTVIKFITLSVLLYFSPHVVAAVKGLFGFGKK